MNRSLYLGLLTSILMANGTFAADWPNWLGPNRNGVSAETGLLTTWPKEGPKVLWKVKGGDGYSSVAIAGGRAITLVQTDAEYAIAFDAVKGDQLWRTKIGPGYKNDFGNGPRSTPAIEGDRVYVHSVTGNFACLDVKSGDVVWQKNILDTFGAKPIKWGLSASPVIEGNMVLAVPGAKGASVVAFDKKNGDVIWKAGDDKAGYATPQPITLGDRRLVLLFTASTFWAVNAKDGATAWSVPWKTGFDCNITTPVLVGDRAFVASGEDVGCALVDLKKGDNVWRFSGTKSPLTTYWATAVLHDGHLFGISGEFSARLDFNCVDVKDGKLKWSKKEFGKGAFILAQGHLFISTKKGDLVLVEATPEKFVEKARVESFLGENRTTPTIADGRMYLRDLEHVYCLDIKGK